MFSHENLLKFCLIIHEISKIIQYIHEISYIVNKKTLIFHYYFQYKMAGNFRENLRSELNFQGITIKELSARTGIPVATLDCYLGARATVPSVDAAFKIAGALQVSVEYLVIGEEVRNKNSPQKNNREARDIIRWIERLNSEQCEAILKLISTFNKSQNREKEQ